jgi:hypothetical protein
MGTHVVLPTVRNLRFSHEHLQYLSNPCKISTGLGLHHLHQDYSFHLCLRSVLNLLPARAPQRLSPVRSLGFGAEFSLRRTRSIFLPKPSVSWSWAVSRSSFLCSLGSVASVVSIRASYICAKVLCRAGST